MLQIHLDQINEKGLDLTQALGTGSLPLLAEVSKKEEISFPHPVHVRLHATLVGESVIIEGDARTRISISCSRCLEPFDLEIETDFTTTAEPELSSSSDIVDQDEIELRADEMDVVRYRGNSIDLRDEISQQLIMSIPFKPLCSDHCKGLCSQCGANRNKKTCRCDSQTDNSPFSVLKELSFPKKEE